VRFPLKIPWSVWTYCLLLAVGWAVVAMPGGPAFNGNAAGIIGLDVVLAIGLLRASRAAWTVATVLHLGFAMALMILLVWPPSPSEAALQVVAIAQAIALLVPATRVWVRSSSGPLGVEPA